MGEWGSVGAYFSCRSCLGISAPPPVDLGSNTMLFKRRKRDISTSPDKQSTSDDVAEASGSVVVAQPSFPMAVTSTQILSADSPVEKL